MGSLAGEARAEAALERGVAGGDRRERPDPRRDRRRTAHIEQSDDWGSYNKWRDEDKLANLVVGVFDTAADAHVSFLASNDLSRAYGAKYGFVVKAEMVGGLGDEAWRLWTHANGREVTYHWRRDNLVTEVHVQCLCDCPPDVDANVDAAARAWADAIDEESAHCGRLAQPAGERDTAGDVPQECCRLALSWSRARGGRARSCARCG